MDKQTKYDQMYMQLALESARMSYAKRNKVGAVLVLPTGLISQGWNGMPAGMDNSCEVYKTTGNLVDLDYDGDVDALETRPEVIHAEDNVLNKIARSTLSAEGSTMYLTVSPCLPCAKRLHGAGVKRVVYKEQYRCTEGIKFLKDNTDVVVEQLGYRQLPRYIVDIYGILFIVEGTLLQPIANHSRFIVEIDTGNVLLDHKDPRRAVRKIANGAIGRLLEGATPWPSVDYSYSADERAELQVVLAQKFCSRIEKATTQGLRSKVASAYEKLKGQPSTFGDWGIYAIGTL